jgi:hypothetical protein
MIKIIDECANSFLADEIERIFLDQLTYWWYDPSTLGCTSLNKNKEFYETFQFVHPIMDNGRADSPHTATVMMLVNKIFSDQDIDIFNYRRIKINQLVKSQNNQSHPPHVDDAAENMISAVYYINDSDGPTYFYDANNQCVNKVQPKKNRCVIFPSNHLHASSSPILNDRRLVINIVAATMKIIDSGIR